MYYERDRSGNPNADYSLGDLTADGGWYQLDLSGIIPPFASAVHFHIKCKQSPLTPLSAGKFRKFGTTEANFTCRVRPQVAAKDIGGTYVCGLDPTRQLGYSILAGNWTTFFFTVHGWWLP